MASAAVVKAFCGRLPSNRFDSRGMRDREREREKRRDRMRLEDYDEALRKR